MDARPPRSRLPRARVELDAHLRRLAPLLHNCVAVVQKHDILEFGHVVPESDGEANRRAANLFVLGDAEIQDFLAFEARALADELQIANRFSQGLDALVYFPTERLVSSSLDRLDAAAVCFHESPFRARADDDPAPPKKRL